MIPNPDRPFDHLPPPVFDRIDRYEMIRQAVLRGANPDSFVGSSDLHAWVDVPDSWGSGKPYSGMALINERWIAAHPIVEKPAMINRKALRQNKVDSISHMIPRFT